MRQLLQSCHWLTLRSTGCIGNTHSAAKMQQALPLQRQCIINRHQTTDSGRAVHARQCGSAHRQPHTPLRRYRTASLPRISTGRASCTHTCSRRNLRVSCTSAGNGSTAAAGRQDAGSSSNGNGRRVVGLVSRTALQPDCSSPRQHLSSTTDAHWRSRPGHQGAPRAA